MYIGRFTLKEEFLCIYVDKSLFLFPFNFSLLSQYDRTKYTGESACSLFFRTRISVSMCKLKREPIKDKTERPSCQQVLTK